jgi:hypothetical protein
MPFRAFLDTAFSAAPVTSSVRIDLAGRFIPPDGEEHPCRILEMSPEAAVLSAPVQPREGDGVFVYLSEFGRLEAEVERHVADGFVVRLRLTDARRRKIAGQLVWYADRDYAGLPEGRRHKRIVPRMQWTRVKLANGKERIVAINDFSRSGVSVESALEVSPGDRVAFGVKTAIVGRVFDGGFAAELEEPFAEGELTETTPL